MQKKRVAIIGGGISGIVASYFLSRKYEVVLYERKNRLGGNAYPTITSDGHHVDMGVIAFSSKGYKNFFTLLSEIGVKTKPTYKFGICLHDMISNKGLYLSPMIKGLIVQKFDLFRKGRIKCYISFLKGRKKLITRFKEGDLDDLSFKDILNQTDEIYGDARRLLIAGLAMSSSMKIPQILSAPANYVIGKINAHPDYLTPKHLTSVRVPINTTHDYLEKLIKVIKPHVRMSSEINNIKRSEHGAKVILKDGSEEVFDKLVLACNADQVLDLLEKPSDLEKETFEKWLYNDKKIILHTDHSHLPDKRIIGGWVCLYKGDIEESDLSINATVWLNNEYLKNTNYIITQYPNYPIKEDCIEKIADMRVPIFNFDSMKAQKNLAIINGQNNTFYCGSYFGYGLHEDAVKSAVVVSKLLGIELSNYDC